MKFGFMFLIVALVAIRANASSELVGNVFIKNNLIPVLVNPARGQFSIGIINFDQTSNLDFKNHRVLASSKTSNTGLTSGPVTLTALFYVQEPGGDPTKFKCSGIPVPELTIGRLSVYTIGRKDSPILLSDSCILLHEKI